MRDDGPTLTLSPDDSRKLFQMLSDGAAPADLFETFDTSDAHYYLKAGMVCEDVKDPNHLVIRVIKILGGDIPEFDINALPHGMEPDSLEAKLMLASTPQAIAIINIGRQGEKRGFGFGSEGRAVEFGRSHSTTTAPWDDMIGPVGGLLGVDDSGNLVEPNGSHVLPNIPAPIKEMLSSIIKDKIMGGPGSTAAIRVAKISIQGDKGEGLNIEIEGLEMDDAEMAETLINSIKGVTKND